MTQTGYFLQLKSRVLMTPLAISPPRSTPEPDISSIPQDAATIPNSAAPQALTGMLNQTLCCKIEGTGLIVRYYAF